jgi:hypothetical protein
VDERERELLSGMGNCYAACHADFDATVGMVADARHLSPTTVLTMLRGLRERDGATEEYRRLRSRFPADFPV